MTGCVRFSSSETFLSQTKAHLQPQPPAHWVTDMLSPGARCYDQAENLGKTFNSMLLVHFTSFPRFTEAISKGVLLSLAYTIPSLSTGI